METLAYFIFCIDMETRRSELNRMNVLYSLDIYLEIYDYVYSNNTW